MDSGVLGLKAGSDALLVVVVAVVVVVGRGNRAECEVAKESGWVVSPRRLREQRVLVADGAPWSTPSPLDPPTATHNERRHTQTDSHARAGLAPS